MDTAASTPPLASFRRWPAWGRRPPVIPASPGQPRRCARSPRFPTARITARRSDGRETRGVEFIDERRSFVLQRTPPALIGFLDGTPTDVLETCGSPTFLDRTRQRRRATPVRQLLRRRRDLRVRSGRAAAGEDVPGRPGPGRAGVRPRNADGRLRRRVRRQQHRRSSISQPGSLDRIPGHSTHRLSEDDPAMNRLSARPPRVSGPRADARV